MRPNRPVIVGGAVLIVLAGIGWYLLRDTTTPVDEDSISFSGEVGSEPGEPGIYRYRTSGYEEIDALQGARHDYPDETFMTITEAGCGFVVRWHALAERWIEWEHCPPDLAVRSTVEYHEWFGVPDTEEESCETPRPTASDGDVVCRAAGSTETYRVSVVGIETIDVGGVQVETIHIRRESELSDGSDGSTVADVWRLVDTPLVVRAEWESTSRTPSPAGDVTYEEEALLELIDLTPRG